MHKLRITKLQGYFMHFTNTSWSLKYKRGLCKEKHIFLSCVFIFDRNILCQWKPKVEDTKYNLILLVTHVCHNHRKHWPQKQYANCGNCSASIYWKVYEIASLIDIFRPAYNMGISYKIGKLITKSIGNNDLWLSLEIITYTSLKCNCLQFLTSYSLCCMHKNPCYHGLII